MMDPVLLGLLKIISFCGGAVLGFVRAVTHA